MTIKSAAQTKANATKIAANAVTYKTKASALRAAKRFNLTNVAIVPAPSDDTRFIYVDTTKSIKRAEASKSNAVPVSWRFLDANHETMTRPEIVKALVAKGINVHTAKAQVYRFNRWLKGTWNRPATCPVTA